MTRDRTSALRQIQSDLGVNESTEQDNGLPPSYEDTVVVQIEGLGELGQFLHQIDEIRDLSKEMKEDVDIVIKKQNDILATPHSDDPKRKELDMLNTRLKKNSKLLQTKLKEIERQIQREQQTEEVSDAQVRIMKTQHSAFLHVFIESMQKYQKAQTDYRDRCKGRIKKQLEITGTHLEDSEVEEMMNQGDISVFTRGIMSETAQAKQMLADIEARHDDIIKLEKSILELHEMFLEMAILVESQGEQLNRIEAHVNSAKEYVETAKEQTQKAIRLQSSARKKKICIIVTIIIIILIIILVIALSF